MTPVKRGKGREGGHGKEIQGERKGKEGYGKEGRAGQGKACIGAPPFTNPRYATEPKYIIKLIKTTSE
jgi:hypothetical protein